MATQENGEGSSSSQPKFFKIIVSSHECTSLSIPEEFGSRYCKNMQNNVYLEVPSGEVWVVEVIHSQGQFWLAKGWKDFSDYYSIYCGHLLLFKYIGRSHFNVIIFDLSATEIEYCYNSSHGTCITNGIRRSHLGKEKMSSMDEHYFENKGRASLGKANKRKRQEGDADDDVSVDMHFKRNGGSCRTHEQEKQSKIVYDKNKTGTGKRRTIAYQKAKAFKSKNPFIIVFMQPTYVTRPYNLCVPLKFSRKYFLENCGNLVLRVSGKGSWSVRCSVRKSDAKIHASWKAFVVDNRLKVGDVCVFETIKGTPLYIDVTIFRAAGSTLKVPYLQPKIVHTKKLKQQRGGSYYYNPKIKEEHAEGTETEHYIEIQRKRKVLEREAEDVTSLSFARKAKKRTGSCRTYTQQSNIAYDKNKTIIDKEQTVAYQRAKAFKSKNPFILLFMQPTYVLRPYALCVPLKFSRKYFPENCGDLVLRASGEGSWSVSYCVRKSDAKMHASWKAFVVDNRLKVGDVCVFEVIKGTPLYIDITIFREAGSTAELQYLRPKIVHTRKLKQQSGGSYRSNPKIKEEHAEGTGIERSVEIQSKRKILEGEPEGAVSKSQQDVTPLCFTRKTKKMGESWRMNNQQSDIAFDKNKRVTDKERTSITYQRAKAFKSENPFIVLLMQPSYVFRPYVLCISLKFSRKYFLGNCGNLVLRVSGKGSWSVKCSARKSVSKMHASWKAFVVDNRLKVGDACVFEVIKGTPLYIDVTIFREAGSTPKVPYLQQKIVQTKKLKKQRGSSYNPYPIIKEEERAEGTRIERSVEILSKRKLLEGEVENAFSNSPEAVAYDMDKERSIAYKRAKDFKSKNPFIISFIRQSYVSKPYNMHISFLDAKKCFQENFHKLLLCVPGRGSWSVKCILGASRAKIRFCWRAFVLDNKLKFGDVCVFEAIKGAKPILYVTIFREAGTISMHKINREMPGVSDCKNKSIKMENSVTCSQPRIVHKRKLNHGKKQIGDSYGFTPKIKEELDEGADKHVKQYKSSHMGRVVAKNMAIACRRAKSFTSENPFFICLMRPSYVSLNFSLHITLAIAKEFFSLRRNDLVLHVSSKGSWDVKCILGKTNATLKYGWREFVLGNDLKVGDVCVFERVDRSESLFNVIIFPAGEGM